MTIGEALKEEQRILGLNNKQMAAGIVSEGTYSKVVNEKRHCKIVCVTMNSSLI